MLIESLRSVEVTIKGASYHRHQLSLKNPKNSVCYPFVINKGRTNGRTFWEICDPTNNMDPGIGQTSKKHSDV